MKRRKVDRVRNFRRGSTMLRIGSKAVHRDRDWCENDAPQAALASLTEILNKGCKKVRNSQRLA